MEELEYIDMEYMQSELSAIYTNARDNFGETEKEKAELQARYDDEYIEELSEIMAEQFNADVKEYLHQDSHSMIGNFNNIDVAYPHHLGITNPFGSFRNPRLVFEMTERLDANDQSEQSQQDRHWLVDWFFETFGTFGIKYNFENEMSDYLYQIEQEEENVETD